MAKGKLPPCPDAENYILVTTKEGQFWRRRRGAVKPAAVNAVLAVNAALLKGTMNAAKNIVKKLLPFIADLETGRKTVKLAALLHKNFKEKGKLVYEHLEGYEWQATYPLAGLLKVPVKLTNNKGFLTIELPVNKLTIKKHNSLVSAYFFEAVLLYGNPANAAALRVESDQSPLYLINDDTKSNCVLTLQLPEKKPWMVVLKASCMEGKQPASHKKHYGMRVIAAG